MNGPTYDLLSLLHHGHPDALETARELLAAGADPRTLTRRGSSLVHRAITTGKTGPDVLRLLLDAGAPADARGADGTSPLEIAICKGDVRVVWLLLAHGADPNAKDAQEDPLLWGAVDVVRIERRRGAPDTSKEEAVVLALLRACARLDPDSGERWREVRRVLFPNLSASERLELAAAVPELRLETT